MIKIQKKLWPLIIFNIVYIIGFASFYFRTLNYEFLAYVGVLVIVGLVVLLTLKKSNLDMFSLWGLSIWGLLHMAGGSIRIDGNTLYSLRLLNIFDGGGQFFILKMDQFVHLFGFGVSAIAIFQILIPHLKNKAKYGLAIFLAFIGSMGLGAMNEVVEFLAFISLEKTGVGDLYNTGLDLIFNMFGAIFGAFIASWWDKGKSRWKTKGKA